MGSIGVPELIIIFVVALIVFGPRKLPELGKSLGKGLAEFRRASNELKSTIEEEVRAIEAEASVNPSIESDSNSNSSSKSSSEVKVDAH
jgi:sec-independent protein translocase protein TatA